MLHSVGDHQMNICYGGDFFFASIVWTFWPQIGSSGHLVIGFNGERVSKKKSEDKWNVFLYLVA